MQLIKRLKENTCANLQRLDCTVGTDEIPSDAYFCV